MMTKVLIDNIFLYFVPIRCPQSLQYFLYVWLWHNCLLAPFCKFTFVWLCSKAIKSYLILSSSCSSSRWLQNKAHEPIICLLLRLLFLYFRFFSLHVFNILNIKLYAHSGRKRNKSWREWDFFDRVSMLLVIFLLLFDPSKPLFFSKNLFNTL